MREREKKGKEKKRNKEGRDREEGTNDLVNKHGEMLGP